MCSLYSITLLLHNLGELQRRTWYVAAMGKFGCLLLFGILDNTKFEKTPGLLPIRYLRCFTFDFNDVTLHKFSWK